MTVIESLLELQEVDGRIRELEAELKDLPRRKAQEVARLSGVSADLQAAKANQEYANQRIRSHEEDAKALKEKIEGIKQSQVTASTNKEYQQLSIQLDLIQHDLEAAENNQIAAMDDMPSADARIADAQAKYDAEKGGVDAFCAEIDERIAAVQAELDEAKKEREAKARSIPDPAFLLYYTRLSTKRWPVVVPLTHDGVCDGCHLVQPPNVGQMADAYSKMQGVGFKPAQIQCTMCGRLLYRD